MTCSSHSAHTRGTSLQLEPYAHIHCTGFSMESCHIHRCIATLLPMWGQIHKTIRPGHEVIRDVARRAITAKGRDGIVRPEQSPVASITPIMRPERPARHRKGTPARVFRTPAETRWKGPAAGNLRNLRHVRSGQSAPRAARRLQGQIQDARLQRAVREAQPEG
ncbi:hypothetical protein PYCCODRAFT_21558 [Trametes coccinea BRFM310]|uniref:Uncharacterized protein n=1 Tax=Trametes coccinea (strain BRFM310) TaxID=1353009 RepID=A0A1Y2J4V9_TRAC3|nr:hypothetical protein PYCCODRAFT_21558 [Trametes coccinea BRFM310]